MGKNSLTLSSLSGLVSEYSEPIEVRRGEIYYVDIEDMGFGTVHVEQKARPALIIQNDIGNTHAPTVIVALLTTSTQKKAYPMHYKIILNKKETIIMFEQILTLDKNRLCDKIGELTPEQLKEADEKLTHSLQLERLNLQYVKDINVVSLNSCRTRTETFMDFSIDILFTYGVKSIKIRLDRLREYDRTINDQINFDELKRKLDCCKGLNWLARNSEI